VFRSYKTFISFARSIPAPRLEAIRHITVVHHPITDPFMESRELRHYRHKYRLENFFALLSCMPKLQSVQLKYIVNVNKDPDNWHPFHIREEGFELLDAWEKSSFVLGCGAWYEISGDTDVLEQCWNGDEGPGRKLFGRWTVGERVRIVMVKA
jgi:hypothetical protein